MWHREDWYTTQQRENDRCSRRQMVATIGEAGRGRDKQDILMQRLEENVTSPTLFQLALPFLSPIQPYSVRLVTSFLACSFTLLPCQLSLVPICFNWVYIPNSSLYTILLLVLEHTSTFLAAVISTCFQQFYVRHFAFPFHTISCMFYVWYNQINQNTR